MARVKLSENILIPISIIPIFFLNIWWHLRNLSGINFCIWTVQKLVLLGGGGTDRTHLPLIECLNRIKCKNSRLMLKKYRVISALYTPLQYNPQHFHRFVPIQRTWWLWPIQGPGATCIHSHVVISEQGLAYPPLNTNIFQMKLLPFSLSFHWLHRITHPFHFFENVRNRVVLLPISSRGISSAFPPHFLHFRVHFWYHFRGNDF